MITIVASPRAKHQTEHQKALAAGLAVHKIPTVLKNNEHEVETDIVACWGWRMGKRLFDAGRKVLVMERGYIGDRFKYTSLAWNGLNGHATFPDRPADNGERFAAHGGIIKPWRKVGSYALILGQVPKDASLQGKKMPPWYSQIAEDIKSIYQIPVHFRQHPDLTKLKIHQRISGTIKSTGTLQEALSGALFTVCYNSNSSVDSVLAGIPCIIGDEGSMAAEVCSREIHNLIRPKREAWAHDLAWKQWSIDEIISGEALFGVVKSL